MADKIPQLYHRDGRAFRPFDLKQHLNGIAEQFAENGKTSTPARVFGSIHELQRGAISYAANILLNSDIAFRRNRALQRMCKRDPDVVAPLYQRQLAVALLEWNVVAEDQDDQAQVDQAVEIKKLIEYNIKRWHWFLKALQDAVWYGPSAVNLVYDVNREGQVVPTEWWPLHSDSLVFDADGNLGMRVGTKFKGEKIASFDGMAHMFDERERAALVLHTFGNEGPDYEEYEEARYIYAGRGLRDVVYYTWLIKQTALQLWTAYIERYSLGTRVGRYPDGNDAAKDEMTTVLKNMIGDISVLLPRSPNENPDAFDVSVLEVNSASNSKVHADMIEGYLSGQIKELIIGQTATTEATATGLGSDVGTRHAETFQRIIKSDALGLADTLTRELVWPVQKFNFGDQPFRPRFEFAVEDVDSQEFMAGVKQAFDMGMAIPERQVQQRLGIDAPDEGEPVLQQQTGGGLGMFDDEAFAFKRTRQMADKYRAAIRG